MAERTIPQNEASLNESSESNWSDLAPPVDIAPPPADPPDTTPEHDPHNCKSCGDPIVREPGARGRWPSYHPDCRPSGQTSRSPATRGRRSGKAEREADEGVAILKAGFAKVAIAVAMVDRYDAFVIMVNSNAICESFRGVLIRYDDFRKEVLNIKGGGSVLGLVFACLTMAAPIAAHHGLIPQKHIQKLLIELPYSLYQLQARMRQGQDAMQNMMDEQAELIRRTRAAEQASQNGNGGYPNQQAANAA